VAVPDIRSLSAYDLNKIQQSLNQYNKSLGGTPRPGLDRGPGFRSMTTANREKAAREPFKSGGTYGIEDEYRYMVSQGFKPESMQVSSQTEAKAEAGGKSSTQPYETKPLQIPSSFISKYGGDLDTRQTGLTSIKKAEASGMSIGDIKYAINAQGITLGPKAAEYLNRPSEQDMALKRIQEQMASREAAFQTALQDQAKMFAEQSERQNQRLQGLQQQMIQSQVAAAERPKTVGVKAATGAGGTQMAIARRGATGAFGRGGMRISSLNV